VPSRTFAFTAARLNPASHRAAIRVDFSFFLGYPIDPPFIRPRRDASRPSRRPLSPLAGRYQSCSPRPLPRSMAKPHPRPSAVLCFSNLLFFQEVPACLPRRADQLCSALQPDGKTPPEATLWTPSSTLEFRDELYCARGTTLCASSSLRRLRCISGPANSLVFGPWQFSRRCRLDMCQEIFLAYIFLSEGALPPPHVACSGPLSVVGHSFNRCALLRFIKRRDFSQVSSPPLRPAPLPRLSPHRACTLPRPHGRVAFFHGIFL